jgi:hypothetical protein
MIAVSIHHVTLPDESSSTHHRLGYSFGGWFPPEPPSASPGLIRVTNVASHRTPERCLKKSRGFWGLAPIESTTKKGIPKMILESVIDES